MKRFIPILAVVFLFSIFQPGSAFTAKDTWISVRSKNFLLLGNAGEKDIRKVGARLEQFRDVFSRIFPRSKANSSIPITVIVFKNDGAFKPFKPLYQGKPAAISGYFQSGEDVNYILLTSEFRENNPYAVIFHEYTHALTSDNSRPLPPWLSEGIAEYYSSFEVEGNNKKVWLGKAVADHVLYMRERQLLPLQRLFAVDHGSPEYNESDRKGAFYAQSWALVHYLMQGNEGKRRPQLIQFIDALVGGASTDDSFKQIFQTDYATLEKELNDYIGRNSYPVQAVTFDEKLSFDSDMRTTRLSEAETQYYLGDALCRIQRHDEGEEYLKRAIALDSKLAPALVSLGISNMRRKRFSESRQYLEQAVAANSRNHLAYYYYAYTLYHELFGEGQLVLNTPKDKAEMIKAALELSIQLAPDFPESHNLLGGLYLAMGENFDAGVDAVKKALAIAPGREDYALTLAHLYVRQERLAEARGLVAPLARGAVRQNIRVRAASVLETIAKIEEIKAKTNAAAAKAEQPRSRGKTPPRNQRRTRGKGASAAPAPTETKAEAAASARPAGSGETSPLALSDTGVRIRFDGERVEGLLTRADCNKGLTLTIKSGVKIVKLHAPDLGTVKFISYAPGGAGEITCGLIKPARSVVVTYKASTNAKSPFAGEPIAVEFVK